MLGSQEKKEVDNRERVQLRALSIVRELEHLLCEEMGLVQLAEEMALEGSHSSLPMAMRRSSRRWSQALHQGAQWEDKRQWA